MSSSNTNDNDVQNQKNDSGHCWTATFEIKIGHYEESIRENKFYYKGNKKDPNL